MNNSADIKQRYRHFADIECQGYSDVYYDLAAVQFVTGPGSMPKTASELRALVKQHGREVAAVMRSRRTQTNEVGRCAVLLPALPSGPLALIEVGASAGLCLLLDRFYYRFGSEAVGDPGSPVHLRCTVAGPAPVPRAIPRVIWRQGLDVNPINVYDDEAVRWVLACVWSDHPERRRRLAGAIDLARVDPPSVNVGDLVDHLPAILANVPSDAQLVVFHSAVLSYVSPDRRQAFADVLANASARRDVVWVSNEAPGIIREVTAMAPSVSNRGFLLGRTRFTNGRRQDELLGLAHPHGSELTWL